MDRFVRPAGRREGVSGRPKGSAANSQRTALLRGDCSSALRRRTMTHRVQYGRCCGDEGPPNDSRGRNTITRFVYCFTHCYMSCFSDAYSAKYSTPPHQFADTVFVLYLTRSSRLVAPPPNKPSQIPPPLRSRWMAIVRRRCERSAPTVEALSRRLAAAKTCTRIIKS
jgi:hypothetical protein